MQRIFLTLAIAPIQLLWLTFGGVEIGRAAIVPAPFSDIIVPNELATKDGNAATMVPYLDDHDVPIGRPAYIGPFHYQQVYRASEFMTLPRGGAFLTVLATHRADCLSPAPFPGQVATNVTITLSTTLKDPDGLSVSFMENQGTDAIVVTNGLRIGAGGGKIGCPNPTDSTLRAFELPIPFFYDPSRGNLLLDLKSTGLTDPFHSGRFDPAFADAQSILGDSVSRVYSHSLSSPLAEFSDTVGLVSYFQFRPFPRIYATLETNTVVIAWPTQPVPFKLQWSNGNLPGIQWATYPGTIEVGFLYSVTTLPQATLTKSRYFRLFWNTPQPGVPQVTPASLEPMPAEQITTPTSTP